MERGARYTAFVNSTDFRLVIEASKIFLSKVSLLIQQIFIERLDMCLEVFYVLGIH